MTSGSPRDVAERFLAAWTSKDFATARSLLYDNLSFQGPIDTFDNADDYMGAISQLATIVTGMEQRKAFSDGQDVCTIYDLITATPAGRVPIAEWHQVRDGRIAAIRVFFDARPFAPPPTP